MKTVAIGDIHGRSIWKKIIDKEKPGRVVFIADYFDSYDISAVEQLHNFNEIVRYKEEHPEIEIKLLIGNHDFHYFQGIGDVGYQGYQPRMAPSYGQALNDAKKHLQMGYMMDDILFTHAGVGEIWLDNTFGPNGWTLDLLEIQLNEMWKHRPMKFNFTGREKHGNDGCQTPIWIRPKALMAFNKKLKKQIIQVVGHTHMDKIDIKGKSTGGRYYFIDTLTDTGGEYLIIEDGKFSSGRI